MVDDLEVILSRRAFVPARSNLAERIIAAAQVKPAKRGFDWRSWTSDVAELFVLPRPALALASVLLIGLFAGWAALSNSDDGPRTISSYLYMNEAINMGEWLL